MPQHDAPLHINAKIEKAFREAQATADSQRALIQQLFSIVQRPEEKITGAEGLRRLQMMAQSYVDVSTRLRLLEELVRSQGACDVDAADRCHTHGVDGPCPIGLMLNVCRPPGPAPAPGGKIEIVEGERKPA